MLRTATESDAYALARLYAEVPVSSPHLAYTTERGADFFAFASRQGHAQRVLVAEAPDGAGGLAGAMTVSFDRVHWDGTAPREAAYTADLRLRPEFRGAGLAGRLMGYAIDVAREALGPGALILTGVASDNAAGRRQNERLAASRGVTMRPVGELRTLFAPAWGGAALPPGIGVAHGPAGLLDWAAGLAEDRAEGALGRAWDAGDWAAFAGETPGLGPAAVVTWRARPGEPISAGGALWDQRAERRIVLQPSAGAAGLLGTMARLPLVGRLSPLPPPGEALALGHAIGLWARTPRGAKAVWRALATLAARGGLRLVGGAFAGGSPFADAAPSNGGVTLLASEDVPPGRLLAPEMAWS